MHILPGFLRSPHPDSHHEPREECPDHTQQDSGETSGWGCRHDIAVTDGQAGYKGKIQGMVDWQSFMTGDQERIIDNQRDRADKFRPESRSGILEMIAET